jgi:hypothetical protein
LIRLFPALFTVVEDYLGSFATRAFLALILLLILAIFLFTIF